MSNHDESQAESQGRRPKLHRRRYIVDKPFQFRLIGTLLAIWVANSAFFSIVLYFLFEGHLRQFYDVVPRPGMLPLLSLSMLFAAAIGFVVVFGLVVMGLIAVYMSNQIAGPLFRTKLCLERVGRGDWGFELRFRQGDFLRDIPGIFNTMLDGLRQQVETDVEELRVIEAASDDPPKAKRLLRKHRERKEALLGLSSSGSGGPGQEPEAVSLAVH